MRVVPAVGAQVGNFVKGGILLNLQEILEYFSFLAGLKEDESSGYLPLCSAAADDLNLQLRRSPQTNAESRQLNRAAACLAFSRYCAVQNCAEGEVSFQAGDVRVTRGGNNQAQDGYQLWREARCAIIPLLKDGEFAFSQVQV